MIWKEKYRIGVDIIDTQHRELFQRVLSFMQTLRSEENWDDRVNNVNETLAFMQAYVVTHFADEESYMKYIGYPDTAKHILFHRDFSAEIHEFSKDYAAQGYHEDLVQAFAGKLLAWLIHHVAAEDQQIGAYARSCGEG